MRELEGLLIRVLAFATLTHQALSLDLAHRVLTRTSVALIKAATVDMPTIAQKVAKHFNHTLGDLRSSKRHKNLALARHVAMYFMKKLTGRSLLDIAAFWHRKDHTTVLHAIAKIESMRRNDTSFNNELVQLEGQLQR